MLWIWCRIELGRDNIEVKNMKKIVYVIISAFYKEGYGYQENILSKKHQELGYDVSIITRDVDGHIGPCDYINDRGVPVHVLKRNPSVWRKVPVVRAYTKMCLGLYERLRVEKPDIIFVHGISAKEHQEVIHYKKRHPEVRLFADSHTDYYNNKSYNTIKGRFVMATGSNRRVRKLADLCEVVWGVTPWRVKFLQEIYKIPASKTDLLVMGGDEKLVDWEHRSEVRERIRDKYCIPQDAFLIVTGGRIDKAKNIHLLVDVVKQIPNAYLLIFGKYEKDMADYPNEIRCERVFNAGWIPSDDSYSHFLAADLGCFPGTHSVLWEQACASGLPCIFKDWDGGFDHVDVGGNAILIKDVTVDNLKQNISSLMENPQKLEAMAEVAGTVARKMFSYIEIAKKAING